MATGNCKAAQPVEESWNMPAELEAGCPCELAPSELVQKGQHSRNATVFLLSLGVILMASYESRLRFHLSSIMKLKAVCRGSLYGT